MALMKLFGCAKNKGGSRFAYQTEGSGKTLWKNKRPILHTRLLWSSAPKGLPCSIVKRSESTNALPLKFTGFFSLASAKTLSQYVRYLAVSISNIGNYFQSNAFSKIIQQMPVAHLHILRIQFTTTTGLHYRLTEAQS